MTPSKQPWVAKAFGGIFEGIGEVERIGARGIGRRVLSFNERVPSGVVGVPVAHQAVGKFGLGFASGLCERAGHQFLAYADAEAAGDKLVEEEAFAAAKFLPGVEDESLSRRLFHLRQPAKIIDPMRQGPVFS